MSAVIHDKFTAQVDQPLVLFLVGGNVNNLLAVGHWFWIARAFLTLIAYLRKHPETGFLSGHLNLRIFPFGMMLQSYWRSFDDLERFARSNDQPHLKAWTRYIQESRKPGAMAIWHETYIIEPGKFEVIYGNTVPYGLSAATSPVIIHGRAHNARGRIDKNDKTVAEEPLVSIPPEA
jgi:hypothetical protein